MKWIKQVVGLLILGLLVVGCKHKQPLVSQGEVDLTRNTAQEVLRMEPSFKSMHISKMSMRVMTDRAEFTFKAVVKMHTDSLVSISVLPALGVEMVRMDFTPSGFLIVDKWNRKYAQGTYDYFKSKWGVMIDYGAIQGLLSNRLFSIPAAKGSLPDCFMVEREGLLLKLVGKQLVMDKQLSFLISTQGRIDECRVGSSDLSMMDVRYSNLKTFDGILFPSVVDVNFNGGKQRMHASLDIERLSFNSNPQVAAIDLKRYTKVTVTNILP